MSGGRPVVILSPHFPPSTLAGVHRARHMARRLPDHGWTPTVVSVEPRHYTEPGDPALAALVPQDLDLVRVGALPARLCRLAGVGDVGLRAFASMEAAVHAAVRRTSAQVVFLTGSPFYPLLMARRLRERLGVGVVLDFQDPWVSAHGATQPPLSKAGASHRLATWLEPMALRGASFVTSVSDTQNAQMATRYPWLDSSRMAAVPIGGEPDDFEALRRSPTLASPQVRLDPGRINISYVGAHLPRAEPLVRRLFAALRGLRASHPALAARLTLHFVGSSNQPGGHDAWMVRPLAEQEGVTDMVEETPQRVPFLEALSILARSHAILMIGSDEPHYTASKIYPGLMSGTPFLSLFHARSSAHEILSAAGGGYALGFETPDELAALTPALEQALVSLSGPERPVGRPDPTAYAAYTAHAVAGRFAGIFDEVAART